MVNESTDWVIIIFAVLLGLGIVYAIARIFIASASPKTADRIERYFIGRDAKRHFGFLLQKGYKISQVAYVDHPLGGWHLQIESPDSEMSIILDQQERPLLAFGKEQVAQQYRIFLEAMIYYLTERKVFIGDSDEESNLSRSQRFAKIANLLRRYLHEIENYVRNDFETSKNEIASLQAQYSNLLVRDT